MKKRQPGRPRDSPNEKNKYPRIVMMGKFRASQGFEEVVKGLVNSGLYKSKSDVYHAAVSVLALRHRLDNEMYNYWVDKIL